MSDDSGKNETTRRAFMVGGAVPALPSTSIGSNLTVVEEAVLNALTGTLDVGLPYPLPTSNSMPAQETTPVRPPVP